MAVTTSGWAPLCARVTLSPANRAITKSEIHNTGFFAFTALAPQFSSLAWGQLKHLGTEATSIKNRLVAGSHSPWPPPLPPPAPQWPKPPKPLQIAARQEMLLRSADRHRTAAQCRPRRAISCGQDRLRRNHGYCREV